MRWILVEGRNPWTVRSSRTLYSYHFIFLGITIPNGQTTNYFHYAILPHDEPSIKNGGGEQKGNKTK